MYKLLVGKSSEHFGVTINTAECGIGVIFSKSHSGVVFEIAIIFLHIYIMGWNKKSEAVSEQ